MNSLHLYAAPVAADPPTSAFERTLLPKFARWFVERVREYKPDVFVPVETKGARLLEAVLGYARVVLDTPLRVPVLYTPALAYVDPAELAASRVMLLDDATRTGQTLRRHRARVGRYGASQVSLLACVGADALDVDDHEGLQGLECFTTVDEDMYREYLWQLAELVVARGLPPEVDHHVFRLSMRGALVDNWETLIDRLRHLGDLSIDGPTTTSADVISMTLHFPAFPDAPLYPLTGAILDEGVKKVRLFADVRHNTIHVVPMAFPALDLPPELDEHDLPEDHCRSVVADWTGGRATVADLLLDRARTRDAELLFRTISTATEVDLICGFARSLAAEFADHTVALTSDRDLFARLYGRSVGDALADRIDTEIASTFDRAQSAPNATDFPDAGPDDGPQPRRINTQVSSTTVEIAKYLKWLSDARLRRPDADPLKRVGMSLTELQRGVMPATLDLQLISRCIDYGLAMTTLVPFTDVERGNDGTIRVRRKYRVSETGRSAYEDIVTSRQEVQEEVIALMARGLSRRTDLWSEGAVSHDVIARVAAVLGPGVLHDQDAELRVTPSPTGPQLVLGDPVNPKTIFTVESELFRLDGAGITPTEEFERRYKERSLRLDRRGGSSAQIEAYIKTIAPLLDAADDVEELLFAWSIAASGQMGLDVVKEHLWRAADELKSPLRTLIRGDRPDPKEITDVSIRARDFIEAARHATALLAADPATVARSAWPDPDRAESDILGALSCPCKPEAFLGLARQLCDAASELVGRVESLAAWGRGVETSEDEQRALAVEVVDATADLERTLMTLAGDIPAPAAPDSADDSRRLAASELKRVLAAIRSRASALAWDYRGEARPRAVPPSSTPRRVTVLAADLDASTPRSVREDHEKNRGWVHPGLNLVGQWGRAFRGTEIVGRKGDDVLIEFPDADSALLCASAVQLHTRALRETGRPDTSWEFRVAVETGEVSDGPGANTTGACVNIAAKLKGFRDDDDDAADRVLVGRETFEACSAELRVLLEKMEHEFLVEPDLESGIDAQAMRFKPLRLDAHAAVARLLGWPAEADVEVQT